MDFAVPVGFPRPVFDPAIPEADRRLLTRRSGDLVPAHRPRPGLGDRVPGHTVLGSILDAIGFGRVVRTYHGQYLCPSDFDAEGIYLLTRAQVAVEAIEKTEVCRHGLLGQFENSLVLGQYLWEMAKTLRTHTVLRAEKQAAFGERPLTPEIRSVLAPQEDALWRSVAAVTERVKMLESYSERVQDADMAYRAHAQLNQNDKYRELLARTGDETGLAALTERAHELQAALTRSLQQAIAAGQTLALPPVASRNLAP